MEKWENEKWEREGILGRWPEYVNFSKVISTGCNQTESNGISWTRHILIDCLKRLIARQP